MGNLLDFNNNPYLMKPLILNVQLRTQINSCGKFSMDAFEFGVCTIGESLLFNSVLYLVLSI